MGSSRWVLWQVGGKDQGGHGHARFPAAERATLVKVVTLQYTPSLGGFDERPLADVVRDKEIRRTGKNGYAPVLSDN